MVQAAERQILFSGCLQARDGTPPRDATLALIQRLGVDMMLEAPQGGCCGARADKRMSDRARADTLAPIYDAAGRGLDIVCLSPACRRVVGAFAPRPTPEHPHPIQVFDVTQLLVDVYGLTRLNSAVQHGLVGLPVAIHPICHFNHNAMVREQFLTGHRIGQALANLTALASGATTLRRMLLMREYGAVVRSTAPVEPGLATSLRRILTGLGATITADVSRSGRCSEVPLPAGRPSRFARRTRPAPCLQAAADSGAEVLVTPCYLCYAGLNGQQSALASSHPARRVSVLHLSQIAGLACEIDPKKLGLARSAVSPRRALSHYIA